MVITRLMAVFNIWRSKVGQEMIFCQIWLVHVTVITRSTIGRHKLLQTHCHSPLSAPRPRSVSLTLFMILRVSQLRHLMNAVWRLFAGQREPVFCAHHSMSAVAVLSPCLCGSDTSYIIPCQAGVTGDHWYAMRGTRARFMRGNKTEMRHCKTVCVELAP